MVPEALGTQLGVHKCREVLNPLLWWATELERGTWGVERGKNRVEAMARTEGQRRRGKEGRDYSEPIQMLGCSPWRLEWGGALLDSS